MTWELPRVTRPSGVVGVSAAADTGRGSVDASVFVRQYKAWEWEVLNGGLMDLTMQKKPGKEVPRAARRRSRKKRK